LRERGYEVSALDALVEKPYQVQVEAEHVGRNGLSYDEIMARVEQEKPEVVGISCIFSNQWPAVKELTRRIKQLSPDILVVTGGTHPSFLPERCLKESELDFIMLSESDRSFPEALDRIRQGRSLSDLDGVAFRDGDAIRVNPKTRWIENLDELPFPAHDLFPPETYYRVALPMGYSLRSRSALPLVTSRGCPCRCTFCSSSQHWGRNYRVRSPENVMAEIEWLVSRFGVRELKFQDDNLTANRERARKIFERMAEMKPRLFWNTPNGLAIWTLDDELLGLMRRSGCYEIVLAIESGDQEVLSKLIRKPLKLDKVEQVNRLVRQHGIDRLAYFIIGFPGETRAQIANTLRFSRRLQLDWRTIFIYNPLPGSELYEECLRRGYITEDSFFQAGNNYFASILNTEEWTSRELETIIRREFLRNYLSYFRDPRLVLPRLYALIRYRPNLLKFFLARTARAFRLMLRARSSPANTATTSS
jgi:magnesium-protoporphyrin IX monomethyl ester (oxidative) cyclase